MTRFYSNPNSDFIAFPTALGGISIISSKIRMIHHKNIFETISNSSSANFQIFKFCLSQFSTFDSFYPAWLIHISLIQRQKSYFEAKSFCLEKNKELVDTLQSGTNSSIDCHVSKDGKRLWNLSENGEVMCFDLRMMKAVNAFEDMFGATSLGLLIQI